MREDDDAVRVEVCVVHDILSKSSLTCLKPFGKLTCFTQKGAESVLAILAVTASPQIARSSLADRNAIHAKSPPITFQLTLP